MEEMFSNDRQQLPGGEDCYCINKALTPFPVPERTSSTVGLLNPQQQPTPLISPRGPQKLRPIRSSGRNCSDPSNGCHSSELGFLPFQPDNLGPNNLDSSSTQDLLQLKADMDAHFLANFTSHISQLHSSFNSSSSDLSDDSEHSLDDEEEKREDEAPNAKPRQKRRRRKKMESYLQDMMAQVIQKQEQMHQELMDVIETKERDRVLREQAWRHQEMVRLQKEHQLRSQEAARSLTLISFIRNALGVPEIQVPHLPTSLPPVFSEDDHSLRQSDYHSLHQPHDHSIQQSHDHIIHQSHDHSIHQSHDHGVHQTPDHSINQLDDQNITRWPTPEVQALITLRIALDHRFRGVGSKTPAWDEISAGMAKMGYSRSSNKCREKWQNINKYYKRATGNGSLQSENAKSCPYFHELEYLYNNRLITATKPNSPTNQGSEPNGNV